MSVQFDDQSIRNYSSNTSQTRGMVSWLIKKGWAKDAAQANTALAVIACICFLLAFLTLVKAPIEREAPDGFEGDNIILDSQT